MGEAGACHDALNGCHSPVDVAYGSCESRGCRLDDRSCWKERDAYCCIAGIVIGSREPSFVMWGKEEAEEAEQLPER